jgi:hypothetical protein
MNLEAKQVFWKVTAEKTKERDAGLAIGRLLWSLFR